MTSIALTSREQATLFWMAVVALFAMSSPPVRVATLNALRALFHPVLLVSALVFAAYMTVGVLAAKHFGIWEARQLKDTLVWTATAGIVFLFSAHQISNQVAWIRTQLRSMVRVSVFLAVFLNFKSFPLPVELVLIPALVFLTAMSAVVEGDPEYAPVESAVSWLLAIAGILMLLIASLSFARTSGQDEILDLASDLGLAVWLPLLALPLVYLFGVYSEYELSLLRIQGCTEDRLVRARSMFAILRVHGFRLRRVSRVGAWEAEALSKASSWSDAKRVVRDHRLSLLQEAEWPKLRDARIERFRGVKGVDDHGCQLDRDEFEQTKEALDLLATAQLGWLRKDGRFNPELVAYFEPFPDLPKNHGIQLQVSKSGKSWKAYRETPPGWIFAVGGTSDTRIWRYEGWEPPTRFPGATAEWRDWLDSDLLNWNREEGELFEILDSGVVAF